MLQDLKYSLRQLGRQPSFTIIAGLTLALGIGVSTALFSVIDAALLRPLPYPNPEELVTLDVKEAREDATGLLCALDGRHSHVANARSDHRACGDGTRQLASGSSSSRPRTPQRLIVAEASDDFLETYGIMPILGRGIQADDTRAGAPAVALLGHAYWQQEFGGDPNVLGRVVRIQNRPVDDRRRVAGRLLCEVPRSGRRRSSRAARLQSAWLRVRR